MNYTYFTNMESKQDMIHIKILGAGCRKCKRTYDRALKAVEQTQSPAKVEKVEDVRDMMPYKILYTPALVIDEEVKIKGRVPTVKEIISLLESRD